MSGCRDGAEAGRAGEFVARYMLVVGVVNSCMERGSASGVGSNAGWDGSAMARGVALLAGRSLCSGVAVALEVAGRWVGCRDSYLGGVMLEFVVGLGRWVEVKRRVGVRLMVEGNVLVRSVRSMAVVEAGERW